MITLQCCCHITVQVFELLIGLHVKIRLKICLKNVAELELLSEMCADSPALCDP